MDPAGRYWIALGACVAVTVASGCAGSPSPHRVRYADIARGGVSDYAGDRPLVVEFQKGDRIPVDFRFSGEFFELEPSPAFELVATDHCFVRFGPDGVHVSPDGEHFDQKPRVPGRFGIGFHAERGEPTKLQVSIVTPRR